MPSSHPEPFALLQSIERRCLEHAVGLPMLVEVEDVWSGVGFRLGRHRLVAPLAEVVEILEIPPVTKVPMTKSWVKGIANVRGNLLPILDLNGFLYGVPTSIAPQCRVLATNYKGVFTGVLVEEVLGLRHFREEERTSVLPSIDEAMRPFMKRAFWRDGEYWGVFSLHRLVETPTFMQVAI